MKQWTDFNDAENKKIEYIRGCLSFIHGVWCPKDFDWGNSKKANVSQVTIYNYFESKHNLIHEVFVYYADKALDEFEQILASNMTFPEK